MRRIDADALIDAMKEQAGCKTCDSYNGARCKACAWDDAITLADDFADKHPAKTFEWISVDDRLPEPIEPVLFTGVNSFGHRYPAQRGSWNGDFWRRDMFGEGGEMYSCTPVTHWMPLPEPPDDKGR